MNGHQLGFIALSVSLPYLSTDVFLLGAVFGMGPDRICSFAARLL